MTPDSQAALERGLEWLARNQGPEGNWGSNDLGLVGMGAGVGLLGVENPGHAAVRLGKSSGFGDCYIGIFEPGADGQTRLTDDPMVLGTRGGRSSKRIAYALTFRTISR